MPVSFPRGDCTFCEYYDEKHNVDCCHCAACWRRRACQAPHSYPDNSGPSLTRVTRTTVPVPATAAALDLVSASAVQEKTISKHLMKDSHCEHSAVPFHHCKQCVLSPYFQPKLSQWDGHAVVCASRCTRRDEHGCFAEYACRHRCGRVEAAARPQYAARAVPHMGPRAALYIKS